MQLSYIRPEVRNYKENINSLTEAANIFKFTLMESEYLYDGEGVKDIPPQNMLLWSIDYFFS